MGAALAAPSLANPGNIRKTIITYAPASVIEIYRAVSTKIKYTGFDPVETTRQINRGRETSLSLPNTVGLPDEYRYGPQALRKYKRWIADTIAESKRNGGTALVVDKAAYELTVYKGGRKLKSFNIELGFNPIDDKYLQGDGCTPEGKYRVSKLKDKGQTDFYQALLIDYPKSSDRTKISLMKAEGHLPASACPGGLIEIHGCGTGKKGKAGGKNWTMGCVAISDDDMDELFRYKITTGTPVTIVRYGTRMDYHFKD